MIRASNRPYGVALDSRTNKELKTKTTMLCDETGSILGPDKIGVLYDPGLISNSLYQYPFCAR